VKEGIWPQMSPIGYVNEKNKGIVPDPELSQSISKRHLRHMQLETSLCAHSATRFNGLGLKRKSGKELAVSNYQKLLKNPIYTSNEYNGEIFEGKHEPIITKKLFDSVQEVMMKRANRNRQNLNHICTEDFSVAESVVVSLPPKHKKVITICDVLNGKILVSKNMSARKSSLLKFKRKSKKFLCQKIGLLGC
jgi:hypothetical protein